MTYIISKDFAFSASHQLEGLPRDHPCSRLHGHNYTVTVRLQGEATNTVGFVVDYRDLGPVKDWLDDTFDHQHLNGLIPGNPTAENLARHITYQVLRVVDLPDGVTVSVGVSETPKTWAWWTP